MCFCPLCQHSIHDTRNDGFHTCISDWHGGRISSVNFFPLDSPLFGLHYTLVVLLSAYVYDLDTPLLGLSPLLSAHTVFLIFALCLFLSDYKLPFFCILVRTPHDTCNSMMYVLNYSCLFLSMVSFFIDKSSVCVPFGLTGWSFLFYYKRRIFPHRFNLSPTTRLSRGFVDTKNRRHFSVSCFFS